MHILNLVFKIKFIFSPLYITNNNNILINKQVFRYSHLTHVLEISPILYNKILKSKSNPTPVNTDIRLAKSEISSRKLHNNTTINRQTWYQYWQEFLYISSNYPELNNFEDIVSKHYFSQNSRIEESENQRIDRKSVV